MQSMEKTISEMHSLLIEIEKSIKRNKHPIVGASSTPQVMAIQGGRVQKYKPQGKAKGKGKGKAELMKKKKKTGGQNIASTSSGIYTIELFAFPKNSWVYDTGCGTHICNIKQGLRGAKKLKRGSLYLYVGNGVRTEVEAIGSFELVLPNGLIIVLDNCHYAPSITRGVVSVSCLVDNGFTQCFTDFGLLVPMNNMLYFNAITANGIYESDMRNSTLPIVNSMYSISNKRTKSNLDSTYLWHCRLAHINKKRIGKLQHDGLLKSTDNELFDQCVSCISGIMTRKPFSHKTEKVKDVLGLIHIDVCGPLRHVSKKGCPKKTMGYYFYYPSENKIVVERYADFLEKDFILQKESKRIVELEDEDILPSKNTSEHPIEEEKIDPDRLCFNVEVEEHSLGDLNEPANYKEALSDPEFKKWLVAINAKMQSMYDNKVWRLVVLLPNAKVVKSKWIYKKKTNIDGKETFSLVADIRAIRILIAISAYYDIKIWQMDVKNAFLNGFLEEEIYMEQPEGFIDPNHPRKSNELTVIAMLDSKPIEMTRNLKLGAMVWKSSKQSTTAQHATEAEYIAASEDAKEAVWIRKYIDELSVVPSNDYPIKMNCENSAAIIMAKESRIQKGARHFKRKYHYVCESTETSEIDIVKVYTYDNLADPFMNDLASPKLTRDVKSMGLRLASSFM
nr:hypothetical protein [Tanacetum cinerariifolium]